MQQIIQFIHNELKQNRFTATDVLTAAGYAKGTLCDMEKHNNARLRTIVDILEVLGYSLRIEKTHEPKIPPSRKYIRRQYKRILPRACSLDTERPLLCDIEQST